MCFLFTWFNMQILNFQYASHRWHSRIYNPLKYLKWSVLRNKYRLEVVNYFCKALHVRCLPGFWIHLWMTHRDLTDCANVFHCENQVFLLLIIPNQSKTKTVSHTIFETFVNDNSRYKTQKLSWWVLWVGDARNIHKTFSIKNHYWNLKLLIVALSSVIKCSLLK